MGIFSKLFGKKAAEDNNEPVRVGGMEDFMTLIRVYYQAVMAAQMGISNINFLPDLAVFKRTLKVPTQNNKLGMMVIGNLMQWKFRMPSLLKKMLRNMTEKTIDDILNKTDWKDDGVRKTCNNIRQYKHALGYSQEWMNDYVYNIVLLAKKEPKPKA